MIVSELKNLIDQEILKSAFNLANAALLFEILGWIQKQDKKFNSTKKISNVFKTVENGLKANNPKSTHDTITKICVDGKKLYAETVLEIINK